MVRGGFSLLTYLVTNLGSPSQLWFPAPFFRLGATFFKLGRLSFLTFFWERFKLCSMMSLLRNRFFLGGVVALLLVLGGLAFKASRPLQVGDFIMPSLPGWTRTVERTALKDSVQYEKDDGSYKYHVAFNLRLNRATSVPQTTQALAAQDIRDSAKVASIFAGVGFQYQTGAPLQRTLNGMPAVETQTLVTSSSTTMYGRGITFVSGSQQYDVYATATLPAGSPPTPPADVAAERDQALDAITQHLIPPA